MSDARSSSLFHAIAQTALRDIAPALDAGSLERALDRVAQGPPLRRGGAEIHLASGRVDLQYCVTPRSESWEDLRHYWAKDISALWCRHTQAHALIASLIEGAPRFAELWLEADADEAEALGVFVGFAPDHALSNRERCDVIIDALALSGPLSTKLHALVSALNDETQVHFAGRFFGREGRESVRLNLRGGWAKGASAWLPAPIFQALSTCDLAPGEQTRAILAIDLTTDEIPRAGLEAGPNVTPQTRAEWMTWIDALPRALQTRVATLAIPWVRSLVAEEGSPWPLAVIVDGLGRPEWSFPLLDRQISHLKQSSAGAGDLETKLYLSFGLEWPSARDA